jgi:phage FluMu protein Com
MEEKEQMVRCTRCGSGFSALHMAGEVNCPRCRQKDGVTADFGPATARATAPAGTETLTEMARRYERGRALLGVGRTRSSA